MNTIDECILIVKCDKWNYGICDSRSIEECNKCCKDVEEERENTHDCPACHEHKYVSSPYTGADAEPYERYNWCSNCGFGDGCDPETYKQPPNILERAEEEEEWETGICCPRCYNPEYERVGVFYLCMDCEYTEPAEFYGPYELTEEEINDEE